MLGKKGIQQMKHTDDETFNKEQTSLLPFCLFFKVFFKKLWPELCLSIKIEEEKSLCTSR